MTTPQQFSRYHIEREVGRGGMATLYLAHDPNFNRKVAIKVLPSQFTHDPQFTARFRREAQAIASLEHPAIVPVYDFGEENNQPFLVMRYMSGGTLRDRLKTRGPLSPADCARIFLQVAPALALAHEIGIVHRDLKPANLLFDRHGNAYVSDFGIAKLAEATANFTGSAIIGTPAYMSPEQVKGDDGVDGRSDVYSLGVMLFEMLTGRQPYQADTPTKQLMKHVLEPVPDVAALAPGLPPGVPEVVSRALAKDPDDRFNTPVHMAENLSRAAGGPVTGIGSAITPPLVMTDPQATAIDVSGDDSDFEATAVQPTAVIADEPQISEKTPPPPAIINEAGDPPQKKRGWFSRRNIFIGIGGVLFLCVAFLILGNLADEGGENGGEGTPVSQSGSLGAAGGDEESGSGVVATSVGQDRPTTAVDLVETPTPIVTDTPGPRETPEETPTAVVIVDAPAGATAELGGNVDEPSGSSPGGGRINPFNNPGAIVTRFPLPEPLPPDAGTYNTPQPGRWTSVDYGGDITCAGRSVPTTTGTSTTVLVTLSDDGSTMIVTGFGEDAGGSIEMTADPEITGRYTGVLPIVQEGIAINFNYTLQLVTDEYIVGFLNSEFSSEGVACTVFRTLDMTFNG